MQHDVRQAARLLARRPAFALTVIITLALGVGVNAALFSVVNFLLLKPLPVENPDRLVVLASRHTGDSSYSGVSYPDFIDLRRETAGQMDLAAYQIGQLGLSGDGPPDRILVSYVTGNFFSMLGLAPAAGRLIAPTEGDHLGGDPIVVLGHAYWQRRFHGETRIVGKSVIANGRVLSVVGVAPANFHGVSALIEPDAYIPVSMAIIRSALQAGAGDFWTNRGSRNLTVVGRLKPGVDLERAQAALTVVAQRLERDHVDTNKGVSATLFPERLARPEPSDSNPLPLVGVVFLVLAGTVLLVACVNVANVLLVRALGRQRELAVRAALGAGRGLLMRQSIIESMLLALVGGATGLALGKLACNWMESMTRQMDFPVHLDFALDWRVFAYSFALTVSVGLFVGVVPALRASRASVSDLLHDGDRTSTGGVWQRRLQYLLVVSQIAGSLVLLICAGLFVRSLQAGERMDLGFDPDHLVNVSMDTDLVGQDETQSRAFYRSLSSAVHGLPGVESASLGYTIPFGYVHANARVYPLSGQIVQPGEQAPEVYYNIVDPNYVANLRLRLLEGRPFRDTDTRDAAPVAIVNAAMARRFWPNEEPLGKRFAVDNAGGPGIEVVGVVRDGKYIEPTDDSVPYFFRPLDQQHSSYLTLQIRTQVPPGVMLHEVEGLLRSRAPNMPTWDTGTMRQALNGVNGLFFFRVGAAIGAVLGLLGLFLAVVGIYVVVAHSVGRRSREIGVRIALGAQRVQILGLIMRQGLTTVAVGLAGGLLVAAGVGQVIASLLVGVSPYDPVTVAAVSTLLAVVAVAANLIPAIRALAIDPNIALRTE